MKIYYVQDNDGRVMVQDEGEVYMSNPNEGELVTCWIDNPEARSMLFGYHKFGAYEVETNLSKLQKMGGIFSQASTYIKRIIKTEKK